MKPILFFIFLSVCLGLHSQSIYYRSSVKELMERLAHINMQITELQHEREYMQKKIAEAQHIKQKRK